jgi:hypothetical protein
MILICIAGATGTGKSTMAKKIVNTSKHVFIYDRQNEYDGIPYYSGQVLPRMRFFGDFAEFTEIAKNVKGYTIVTEEATGIFSGRASRQFIDIVLSKRHTNNTFILIFHSIHRIPMNIYEFTDVFIMHKTNDIIDNVRKRYPNIYKSFIEVNNVNNKDYNYKKIIKLTGL